MLESTVTSRRSIPYPGEPAIFVTSSEIWDCTLDELRTYGRLGSEGLVFWAGIVTGPHLQVTGLYLPVHTAQGGVRLSPDQSRWLVTRLAERDEKLIAQVHSHPGRGFHSRGDDAGAASFHAGFLSIVVPSFGEAVTKVEECACYEYQAGAFREIPRDSISKRIKVVPMIERRVQVPERGRRWLTTIALNLKRKLIGLRKH